MSMDTDNLIICWPESQRLMGLDGFEDNCELIMDDDKYGPAAYIVDKEWYEKSGYVKNGHS